MASFGSFCMFCHHKKKQRNQTLEFSLGGLLFGCIVSFVVRNLCLGHRAHRSYLLVVFTAALPSTISSTIIRYAVSKTSTSASEGCSRYYY